MRAGYGLIVLLCFVALLVGGCGKSTAPKKVKGPGGVTLERGQLDQQEKDAYRDQWLEQKRRQGVKLPEQPK